MPETEAGPEKEPSLWDSGVEMFEKVKSVAELGLHGAESAFPAVEHAMEGGLGKIAPGISGLMAMNDTNNAYGKDAGTEKANFDKASAVTNIASMVPMVGTVMGTAGLIGEGFGKAIGWDDEKEGTNPLNYGIERTGEALGLLKHVNSKSENESLAQAKEALGPGSISNKPYIEPPDGGGQWPAGQ